MKKININDEKCFGILKTLIALGIALVITFVTLCFTSKTPVNSFLTILTAPLTKLRYFCNVFEKAVPLIFVALGYSVLFRSGIFNLGGEGIFYICGIMTTYLATKISINNGFVHPLLIILASAIFGGLLMMIPGFLKVKYNANIILTSLMLNSIYFGIGLWFLKTYMLATDVSTIASPLFAETARLPYLFKGTRITIGFFIAILAVVIVHILVNHTRLGYKIRMTGINAKFAKYSGIKAFSLFLVIHFISGLLMGMGSSIELLSLYKRFTWSEVTDHAVTGILLAMMGNNKPIPVFVAVIGVSYLRVGAEVMARSTAVPMEIVSIIEATLVLLISAKYFLKKIREKRLVKEEVAHV